MTASHRILSFAAFIMALLPFTAAAGDKTESAFVRARIFNVPQNTADALMAEKDFLTNINGSLAKLAALVQKNEAVILANPSAQTNIPSRVSVTGLVGMKFELTPSNTANTVNMAVYVNYAGQELIGSTVTIKRGDALFLGSFDPPKTGATASPGTNLVFVVLQ